MKAKQTRNSSHSVRVSLTVAFLVAANLFLCSAALPAQTTAAPVPTWAQSYGFGSYDEHGQPVDDNSSGSGVDLPSGIGAMPDGGVVVAGLLSPFELQQPGTANGGGDPGLVRYDAKGAIVWQQLLKVPSDNQPTPGGYAIPHSTIRRLLTDAAGNIFVCGNKGNSGPDGARPYVAKFGPNGGMIWYDGLTTVITHSDQFGDQANGVSEYYSMDLTSDGGVIVGSYVYSGGNGRYDPIIVKFNADGSLGFHRVLYASAFQYSGVLTLCERPGGNGYAVVLLDMSGAGGEVVVLTDAMGNPVSQRSFPSDPNEPGVNFITKSADGGFLFLSRSGTRVHKIHADLTPIWSQDLQSFAGANILTPTSDGGCIIGGSLAEVAFEGHGNGHNSALYLTLDGSGLLRSAHLLGGPGGKAGGEGPSGLLSASGVPLVSCLTTDGAVAFSISTFSYATGSSYKADWWTVKADANGKVQGFGDTMLDVPLEYFQEAPTTESASVVSNSYGAGLPNEVSATADPGTAYIQEDLGNNTGINKPTIKNQTTTPIPPPVHGGLSGMTFSVDESTDSTPGVADTVLRFRAVQSGVPAGLNVSVQVSTDGAKTWTNLADANSGSMLYAPGQTAFVLNSTAYPSVNNVYFRAFAKGSGYPNPASAPVGRFDLASNKPHLPPLGLLVKRNGTSADIKFMAGLTAPPSGTSLRIQSSTTPADESSWTDLADGNMGQMTRSTNPTYPDLFLLLANQVSASTDPVFYRAIASVSGSLDSISNFTGPYALIVDIPPAIVHFVPPASQGGSGTQTDPFIVPAGQIRFSADATPDPQRPPSKISSLKLAIDGKIITDNPGAPASVDYRYNVIGDHVLEAVATDDLGATSRAETNPVYIRVIPSGSGAVKAERASGGSTMAASTVGKVYTVVNSGGIFSDASTWKDAQGNNGAPGVNDFAIVGNASLRFSLDVTVRAISIDGGRLIGPGNLDVIETMTVFGMSVDDYVGIFIDSGAVCELVNRSDVRFNTVNGGRGLFYNKGTINVHGSGGLIGMDSFSNRGTLHWETPINLPLNLNSDPAADVRSILGNNLDTTGLIIGLNPNGLVASGGGNLVASGGGNLVKLISQDGGGIVSHDSGGLISQDGGGIVSHDSGGLVASGGGNFIGKNGGPSGASATSRTSASIKADTAPSGFTQTGGNTDLSAVTIVGPVTLNGGVLSGSGIIQGDLTNNGGYITPGLIAVNGNFAQGANGTLVLENGGPLPSQFSQLSVGGAATLGGHLDVKLINGYVPDVADTFNPVGYSSVSGSFASVSGNAQVTVNSTGLLSSVNPAIASPSAGQPLNISTRMEVLGGNNVLIGGFIVTGPSGSTKKVLIRGIGPSLANYGINGVLADPLLEFHNSNGSTTTNDNWNDAPNKDQIPVGFAPSNPKESVIIATLAPGSYTVIEKGAHGETGIGLTEIYDLDGSTSVTTLANISTRGFIDTNDNVMIGGFIVGGTEPAQILVRATGPSLKNFGLTGVLEDPVLELHDANGGVISNDDWRATQESEIIASTVAPSDDKEPAILATLVPGAYTAIVRGKDGTTGIGIVEAYKIK